MVVVQHAIVRARWFMTTASDDDNIWGPIVAYN